jgi:cytochrome P450
MPQWTSSVPPQMAFFDPSRASYRANPYPALAALRRADPVHWSGDLHAWIPTRYAECATVLHDGARFTSNPGHTAGVRAEAVAAHRAAVPLGTIPNLGTTSGAGHRDIRRRVNPVFAPVAIRAAAAGIAVQVTRLLDTLPTGDTFDFMAAFASPLPRRSMVAIIGVPEGDGDGLERAFAAIETTRSAFRPGPLLIAAAQAAAEDAAGYLEPYRNGALSVATVLGALMPAGGVAGPAEVASIAAQIATVGAEPTTGALGNAMAALAANPRACALLRGEPRRLHLAVHELLRYDSSTHIVPRFAAIDSELGGKHIRRGDTVLAVVGAANRDPAAFTSPDKLDCDRDARRQLGFGQGEHICLGAPLALAILEAALTALLARFSCIELAAQPEYGPAVQLRIPAKLLLRCT